MVPAYKQIARAWSSEATLVRQVEERVPGNAMIFDAPYNPFPERSYDEGRPYLHSKRLRWSFGAMEGRPADWAASLAGQPGSVLIPSIAAAGFAGVWVTRPLYPDGGAAADADLRGRAGATPLTSPDGQFSFYDLRPYAARLTAALGPGVKRLGELTLHPVRVDYGADFTTREFQSGPASSISNVRSMTAPDASFTIVNPSPFARRIDFAATLQTLAGATAHVIVHWEDGTASSVDASRNGAPLRRSLSVPPGAHSARIVSDQPLNPAVKQYLALRDVAITDQEVAALVRRAPGAAP
jgi:phosphoglycerol transferase